MIESLSIKNIATFNDHGVTINDLKQINIIYGANGSGKSTISKVVANIDSYNQSSIAWRDDRNIEVLAYNKDFCEKNFLEQMPGVFTLGEASTTAIAEIEKKRTELQEITAIGKNYKSDIDKQTYTKNEENKSFCESAWNDVLKKYEQWFPKSAIGAGTKDRFIEKLLAAHKQDHSNPLSIEELKKKAGVLFGQQPLRMNSYNLIDKWFYCN